MIRQLLVAEAVRGSAIGGGLVVFGVASDGWEHLRFALLAGITMVGLFLLIGIGQAVYWRMRYGDTRYDFCGDELRVVRDGTEIKSWPRDEIYYLLSRASVQAGTGS